MTTKPSRPGGPAPFSTPKRPRPRHLDALADALRRSTPAKTPVDRSRSTLGRLVIEGPASAPSAEPCVATALDAGAWTPTPGPDARPGGDR
ncbi:MAG: hypothetical protein AAFX50_16885, partial [Acidobacteriota bacterium]